MEAVESDALSKFQSETLSRERRTEGLPITRDGMMQQSSNGRTDNTRMPSGVDISSLQSAAHRDDQSDLGSNRAKYRIGKMGSHVVGSSGNCKRYFSIFETSQTINDNERQDGSIEPVLEKNESPPRIKATGALDDTPSRRATLKTTKLKSTIFINKDNQSIEFTPKSIQKKIF